MIAGRLCPSVCHLDEPEPRRDVDLSLVICQFSFVISRLILSTASQRQFMPKWREGGRRSDQGVRCDHQPLSQQLLNSVSERGSEP